jgi:hypothetical protein
VIYKNVFIRGLLAVFMFQYKDHSLRFQSEVFVLEVWTILFCFHFSPLYSNSYFQTLPVSQELHVIGIVFTQHKRQISLISN